MDSAEWDARYSAEPTLWGAEPNQFVRARLGGADPGRAVDLACGNGRNAVWLARRGWRVAGVDISAVALGQAAERSAEQGVDVAWEQSDALSWRPAGPLDLVLVAYLHVPCAELVAMLARAGQWLAPGGRLVYVGHSRTNLARGVGGPSEAAVLVEIAELAEAAAALRVVALEHALRETEKGTAIDILLEATPWAAPEPRAEPSAGDEHPGVTRRAQA